MTWQEAGDIIARNPVAVIPLGAVEQHGYHLPLSSDTIIALEIAKRTAWVLEDEGRPVLVGPSIPFGVNPEAMTYPGSISIKPETLKILIKDVILSLARHGVKRFVLLMGHDGNIPAMEVAAQELLEDQQLDVACVNWLVASAGEQRRIVGATGPDGHGGAGETSRVLAALPELVYLDRAVPYQPAPASTAPVPGSGSPIFGGGVFHPFRTSRFGQTPPQYPGQLGDPRIATVKAGEQIYDFLVDWFAAVIRQEFPL
jgi:creatinine amidohydrolase